MEYLFDSSSIYTIAKAGNTQILIQKYTCSLARYELGNILLKEWRLKKTIGEFELTYLFSAVTHALRFMSVRGVKDSERSVMGIATKFNLSFYDASYVYLTKALGTALVTEDDKLARKIKGYVETLTAEELT